MKLEQRPIEGVLVIHFEGKGTIVVQALTRHGENYIKTLQVQL